MNHLARCRSNRLRRSNLPSALPLARWCVAFLAGFVGPMVLRPDLPQGPLLGIFFTGPLGAIAGAILGAVVGLLVPSTSARR